MRAVLLCYIGLLFLAGCHCHLCESETKSAAKEGCTECGCTEMSRTAILDKKDEAAADITLKTVKFDAFMKDIKAQSGKVVCAYQWTNANAACKKNLPVLIELQRKFAKDVVFMTVSSDLAKDGPGALKHLEAIKCDLVNYLEDENDTVDGWTSCFGCCGFPGLVVFGRDGKKAATFEATELPFEAATIEKTLVKLIKN